MVILFTGFEPFGKWDVNPTQEAIIALDGKSYNGISIVGKVIPLKYLQIRDVLSKLVKQYKPRAIVLSGQAGGESIKLERRAHNLINCNIPYNCGSLITDTVIEIKGSDNYSSSLPLDDIYKKLSENNISVEFSDNAGSFGCNQVFYHCRHDFPSIPSGFIHVPLLPEQKSDSMQYMDQETITKGFEVILQHIAHWLH